MEKSEKMDCDYEDLYKWIELHQITRPKRNINRDFADAMPLVEILKHHFPKLVEMHNYTPKNSFLHKIVNWETLNNRVLKKLNLNLTRKRIELLAKGETGAIEKLLLELKKKIEAKSAGDENCVDVVYLEGPSSISGKNQNSPNNKKVIPMAIFEKLQGEVAEKSEAITILKNKVDHLENLLTIKEERIKDLSQQLQAIVNQSARPGSPSKFFGFFNSSNTGVNEEIKNE